MYVLGIDDAGRGPILGPMFLAGVLIKASDEKTLKDLGARDSKLLYQSQRVSISEKINKIAKVHLVKADPELIDDAVFSGLNLNNLEAKLSADIINKLNNKKDKIKVIVDCPSVNALAWKNKLISFIEHPDNLDVRCEHKADFNHAVVGAASILAKVAREESVAELKKKFGSIGSGYPSDPVTIEFLKLNGKSIENSGIVRKSWATWKKLFPPKTQSKLF